MENAVDGLKIAFAMLMFGMALTLSISSFSKATLAVQTIVTARDREADYTYVQPTSNYSRTVGIESVVTSMYRAYEENLEIYFYQKDASGAEIPLYIYNITEDDGTIIGQTNCIDLAHEHLKFATKNDANEFLNALIGGDNLATWTTISSKYTNRFIYTNGIYEQFKGNTFEEKLGEYIQGSGTSEITKRVITFVKQ